MCHTKCLIDASEVSYKVFYAGLILFFTVGTIITQHNMNSWVPINSVIKKAIYLTKALGLILLISFSQASYSALSHDQALIWKSLHSDNFNIHFHNNEYEIAQKTLNISEHTLLRLQNVFKWIPDHPIDIIVSDEKDIAPPEILYIPPKLQFTIHLTAPEQFSDFDNWLQQTITQKLTQLIHLDKRSELPLTLKNSFGRHPLLFPNFYQPNWLKAGLTIYLETDKINGTGEGQSSFFEMMMRMEVAKGLKTLEQINIRISTWPADQTHKLYGYFFYQFLETQYGKQAVHKFIDQYSRNIIPFRVDHSTNLSFNKTMQELWDEYVQYLQDIFDIQTNDILQAKITAGSRITDNGYYKIFAKPIDDVNLLIAQYDGVNRPEIFLKNSNTGSSLFISNIEADAQVDADSDAGVIISQVEAHRNTNHFKDLYHIDIHTKEMKRLTRGDRYIRTTWHPDGEQMIAVHTKLGKHTLVLLSQDGRLIDLLWEGKEGEYIGGINWSPDGIKLVASIKRDNTSWQLEEFDINKRRWTKLTFTSDIEAQPHYSKDGKSIFFTADYMGVFNIRRLDLDTKNITTLTNVIGGAFSPQPGNNNDLYYIGYTEKGYDIFHLAQIQDLNIDTILKNIVKEDKTQINDAIKFETTEYSTLRYLAPKWWSPTLQIDTESTKLGLFTTASDPLNRHSYDALLSFDIDSSTTSGELNYRYDRWFPLIQFYLSNNNRNDFRHEVYQGELLAPLISVTGKWFLGFSYASDKIFEKDPLDQSKKVTRHNPSAGFGLIYDSRKRNLISNSLSTGRLLTLVAETSNISNSDYDGHALIGKWQEYITIKPEHVIGFRMIGGFGLEEPRNFQLGGYTRGEFISNNLFSDVPPKSTLYNNRSYSFRGYKQNKAALSGRRMVVYNLEWRFPIKRIGQTLEKAPIFGIDQVAGTVFTAIGSVWDQGLWPQQYKHSIGGELRFFTELFYFLPTQIRTGYAYGFDKEGEDQVYISFNSSF